jgi:hypothetical protein
MRILESVLMLKKNKSITTVALDVGIPAPRHLAMHSARRLAFRHLITD